MAEAAETATLPDTAGAIAQPAGVPRVQAELSPLGTVAGVLGKAADQYGEAVSKFGDVYAQHALKLAQLNNQAASDAANWQYNKEAGGLMAQFDEQHKFVKPEDSDALYQDLATKLEGLRQKYRGSLTNMMAQSMYDQDSRRMSGYLLMGSARTLAAGTFAFREQAKNGMQETLTARAAQTTDPKEQEDILQQITTSEYAWGKSLNMPEEAIQANILTQTSKVGISVVDSMLKSDPHGAKAWMEAHKGDFTAEAWGHASEAVTTGVLTDDVAYLANKYAGGGTGTAGTGAGAGATYDYKGGPVDKNAMRSAIIGGESGGRANAVSVQGAQGPMQVTQGLFNTWKKPGESWSNPKDREAVGDRAYDHYYEQYKGDPGRIATAWFSGPGNVAPEGSATPWKDPTKHDALGTTVAGYVADKMQRLGHPGAVGGVGPGDKLSQMQAGAGAAFAGLDAEAEAIAKRDGLDVNVLKEQAEAKLKGNYDRAEWIQQQQTRGIQSDLLTSIEGGIDGSGQPITNQTDLLKQPGMQDKWNMLTEEQRNNLRGVMQRQLAQSSYIERARIEGEKVNDMEHFLGEDYTSPKYHGLLSNADMKALTEEQIQLKLHNQKQADYHVTQGLIYGNSLVLSDLKKAGMINAQNRPVNEDDFNVFTGMLVEKIHNWSADPKNKGRKPDFTDIGSMASDILAHRHAIAGSGWFGTNWFPKSEPYDMSKYESARGYLTQRLGRDPEPWEVGELMENGP